MENRPEVRARQGKRGGRGVGCGLFGLHREGELAGKLFTIIRNCVGLGEAVLH